MGNIPLTTLLILLLSLPGYISRIFYFSGDLNKSILPTNIKDDIASSIIFSFPIHLIGIFFVEHLHYLFGVLPDINFKIILQIISGHLLDENEQSKNILDNLYSNIHWIISYFFLIILLAGGLGKLMNYLVWKLEMDLKFPSLFKFGNQWLYYLTGRGSQKTKKKENKEIIPIVDAMADLGEKTRLYRGVLFNFNTDNSGSLREIFLKLAVRGKFEEDTKTRKNVFYWEEIPGDIFILPYKSIINLNITYYQKE